MAEFLIHTDVVEQQGKRFAVDVLSAVKTVKNMIFQVSDASEEIKYVEKI